MIIKLLFYLQTYCDIDYANWPWGWQNCTYKSGSWTYDQSEFEFGT